MNLSELTTSIPPELKKLVKLVGRSFYQPLHVVCLDVLTSYPCVTEGDLVEVLRMQGSQRQLRQALTFLKKDKIIKSQQRMEGESGLVHYYYINYKHFVNVVKYKLDQIRRRIEAEEKQVKNRTSYKCPSCSSTYSDLDVDRLFNPSDGSLVCSHCSSTLEEEDIHDPDRVDSRTLISMLNEQIRPITELLKIAEKVNLAPDVLEPEPSSMKQVRDSSRRSGSTSGPSETWSRNRPMMDFYGENAGISVHMGSGADVSSKVHSKAVPEWMARSTVQQEEDPTSKSVEEKAVPATNAQRDKKDDQILADLLTHEVQTEATKEPMASAVERSEYSSSGSDSDEEMEDVGLSEEEDDSEQFIVKVGDLSVPLDQITDSLVAQMTDEEKERYKQVYQLASMHVEDL